MGDKCPNCGMLDCYRRDDPSAQLRRRIADLEAAVHWALGEEGEWPDRPQGSGPFWWRRELRARAKVGKVGV